MSRRRIKPPQVNYLLSGYIPPPPDIPRPAIPDDPPRPAEAAEDVIARRLGGDTLPHTRLDWALWWARRGMWVFPCEEFLGTPIEPKWYSAATSARPALIAWWTASPDADIGVVPERSGHYVIVARGHRGRVSLFELEDECGGLAPAFSYVTRWGDLHVWLKGEVFSSHEKLAPGLDVIGPGRFVFLPPSAAPDYLS